MPALPHISTSIIVNDLLEPRFWPTSGLPAIRPERDPRRSRSNIADTQQVPQKRETKPVDLAARRSTYWLEEEKVPLTTTIKEETIKRRI